MKPIIFILLLFFLSSCWPYYKQLDDNDQPINTHKIALHDCELDFSLEKQYLDVSGDYHVIVAIKPVKGIQLKAGDIDVMLSACKSRKIYVPGDIKFWDWTEGEPFINKHPDKTPSISKSQNLSLEPGKYYLLVYTFYGSHHHKLKLDINANINGEPVKRSMIFKKFTQFQLLH